MSARKEVLKGITRANTFQGTRRYMFLHCLKFQGDLITVTLVLLCKLKEKIKQTELAGPQFS